MRLADGSGTWAETYGGSYFAIVIDGLTVSIFNDCDELDYIDSVVTAERETFDDWCEWTPDDLTGIFCPLDLLTPEEHNKFKQLLEGLTK